MSDQGRVLVVDDDRLNRSLLSTNLRGLGYAVETAEDGAQALAMLQRACYDAILLDLVMPGMDGFEVLTRLKEDPATRAIPVIVISGNQEVESTVRCIELGATDYLTKPFNATILRARLSASLANKRLHDAQERYLSALQAHNAELDAFAHTVAHDLKQPVAAIYGYSGLLLADYPGTLNEDQYEIATQIEHLSKQTSSIIHELLLLASVRQEDVRVSRLNMVACLAAVQERLALLIKSEQASLSIPTAWPVALGYQPWVEEIWANYLSNALKYGGDQPRIELGATPQPDGMIRFWVRDYGLGMTAEQQTNLFVPFTRLNQVRIEGQGLGLSIVQRIAEKLGGQVGVSSAPEQGSTFWFALPAASS
jgi:two-component system sensor histidine kinase/response regulator